MKDLGTGFLVIVVSVIAGLLLFLVPIKTEPAVWTQPIWSSYTYNGHRYVIVKFGESIAVTHDESCTTR